MYKHAFRLISPMVLALFFLPVITYASDISITNEVDSPANRTVWTNNSEGMLSEAAIAINLTNEVKSREPVTVILAIDCSASMIESDPNKFRVKAGKDFVNLLTQEDVKDKVGIVLWNDIVFGVLEPTEDLDAVKEYLDRADASGFTCISGALNAADLFFQNATTNGKVLILLSDGIAECYTGGDFNAKARKMRSNGVSIYTIGLGDSNVEELRAIGEYYHVSRPDAMPLIFSDIATKVKISLRHVKVEYNLPKNLEPYDIFPAAAYSSNGNGNILTWYVRDMYYKQNTTLNLRIRAENPGNYTIPLPINSTITYFIVGNGTYREQIPSTNLLVKFHQSGNDGNEDSNYIQISQPLKSEEANELFGKSSQSNDIALPA